MACINPTTSFLYSKSFCFVIGLWPHIIDGALSSSSEVKIHLSLVTLAWLLFVSVKDPPFCATSELFASGTLLCDIKLDVFYQRCGVSTDYKFFIVATHKHTQIRCHMLQQTSQCYRHCLHLQKRQHQQYNLLFDSMTLCT